MDHKAIQSEINRVNGELQQLADRQYYTEEQEKQRRPRLEAKLLELNDQLAKSDVNNIDVRL